MAHDHIQLSITLPRDLLAEIDSRAAAELRSRSNYILVSLAAMLAQTRPKGEPAKEREGDGT